MTEEPFFIRDGGSFIPLPPCRAPWDPRSLQGRVVVALCCWQIEQGHELTDYMPALVTIDMDRLPRFAPIEVTTRVVRDGRRIKVIDAKFTSKGVSYARATSQWLKRSQTAEGNMWSPPNWEVPGPETLPEQAIRLNSLIWLRECRELVGGTPLTPFMRAAIAADLAHPYCDSGDRGRGYINSDLTLYLHRLPADAWIGVEVVNHQATDGAATGGLVLYDRAGAIGTSSVRGAAQRT